MNTRKGIPSPDPVRMATIRKNILSFHYQRNRLKKLVRVGTVCFTIVLAFLSLWRLFQKHRQLLSFVQRYVYLNPKEERGC